jgi:acyl-CoA thioesterase-1
LTSNPAYPTDYARMFADLAAQYGDLYYPDFKAGVVGHPESLQPDGDHPNGPGNALITDKMLPLVTSLVARANQP